MKKEKSFADKIIHDLATFPEEHPIATSIMATLGVVSVGSIVGYREALKEERNAHDIYFDTGFNFGVASITHDILEKGGVIVNINDGDGTSESHVFVERKEDNES